MDKINNKHTPHDNSIKHGLFIFFRLNTWILAPLLIGIVIGKVIDNSFYSEPWGVLGGVIFGFVISLMGLIIESRRINKKK